MKESDFSLPKGVKTLQRMNHLIGVWLVMILSAGLFTAGFLLVMLKQVEGVDTSPERSFVRMSTAFFILVCLLNLALLFLAGRKLAEVDGKCRKLLMVIYAQQLLLMPVFGILIAVAGFNLLLRDHETREVLSEGADTELRIGWISVFVSVFLVVFVGASFCGSGSTTLRNYEKKLRAESEKMEAEKQAQAQFRKGLPAGSVYDNQSGNVYF